MIALSRYTTELRYLLENPDWTDERLGLADYPIFDEDYRVKLNTLIKNYFMFDEIGSETPYRFAQRLRTRMGLIMPYYNQLYLSALLDIQPFLTMRYDVKTDSTLSEILNSIRKNKQSSDGLEASKTNTENRTDETGNKVSSDNRDSDNSSNSTSHDLKTGVDGKRMGYASVDHGHSMDVSSDTPEGFIQTSTIESGTYANSASKNEFRNEKDGHDSVNDNYIHDDYNYSTGSGKDSSTGNGIEVSSKNSTGNVLGDAIKNNIFNQILDELNDSIKNQSSDTLAHYEGFNGKSMSQLVNELRGTFVNIDMMILNELEKLFISVLN